MHRHPQYNLISIREGRFGSDVSESVSGLEQFFVPTC
jgi:hypothetical protein